MPHSWCKSEKASLIVDHWHQVSITACERINRTAPALVEQTLADHGIWNAVVCLLASHRMRQSDYEAWRLDDAACLEDAVIGNRQRILDMLDAALAHAQSMGLNSAAITWAGWGKQAEKLLRLFRDDAANARFQIQLAPAADRKQLDIFMVAGDIKESRILHQYELGFKSNGKAQSKVGRDILFIKRNLDFLKPGGRMAIVLPQGRFNNTSDKHIREFISWHGRILAVVGLHGNTFKPHTGTKTSVLFVQKWNNNPDAGPLCRKVVDYPIFFAVSEKGGKNNSGDYIYVKNGDGKERLDKNGHLIVDHDLHNHDGELPDGIAEAFINWATGEKLSFWR